MKTKEVNNNQWKILHLLHNMPGEKHKVANLAVKLNLHPNTVRTELSLLIAKNLIYKIKTTEGSVLYFLNHKIKNNVNESVVVVRV